MLSEKEKMIRGEPYNAFDPELVALKTQVRKLVKEYNNLDGDEKERIKSLFHEIIPDQGDNCQFLPPLRYDYGSNIHLGNNVSMDFDSVILDVSPVYIGDNCKFGPRCSLYTATHPIDAEDRKKFGLSKKIIIGNNCLFGASVSICPGVTIGNHVIIKDGSLVCKDIPSNCIAEGNPCKVVRYLSDASQ
ncbi:hypothetical protein WA158_000729 [Blastocystis sp. Blastoise]